MTAKIFEGQIRNHAMLRFIKMKLRIMMEDNFFMGVFKRFDFWLPKTQNLRKWPHGPISLLSASCIKEFFVGISLQHLQIQLPSYHLHFDHCDDDQDCENGSEAPSSRSPTSYHEALALLSCRGLFRKRDIFTQTSRHSILGKLFVQLIDHESDISEPHFRNWY